MSLRIQQKDKDIELVGIDGGGSEILHYKGKPFTGLYLIYENEGWLSSEVEFQNGYREGWERDYYENGQLEQEYKMHNNIEVPGTYKRFDESGTLIESY